MMVTIAHQQPSPRTPSMSAESLEIASQLSVLSETCWWVHNQPLFAPVTNKVARRGRPVP